jgi:hypothetical protein
MNLYDRQQIHSGRRRHEFRAEEYTAECVTTFARRSTPRSASRFQFVMISARSAEENTEERATTSFVIILLSRFVHPFSSALNAQRGGPHRGARPEFRAEEHTAEARHEFRAEEQTEERVTISARRDLRAQRGGKYRGARHDFRAEEQTEELVAISARHN